MRKGESKRIDWDEIKQRLHESQLVLDKAQADDPERAEAVYRQRAAQLASRAEQAGPAAAALRVLVFSLGAERYALAFSDLAEMLPFTGCVPVPGGPPQLLGVANIHGEIRSVLDLGRLLELPETGPAASGYIVLVRKQDRMTALRVDCLETSRLIFLEELAVPSSGETDACFRYLKGLTPDKVRLLNTEALLAHPVFGRGQESAVRNQRAENNQHTAPVRESAQAPGSRPLRGEITS